MGRSQFGHLEGIYGAIALGVFVVVVAVIALALLRRGAGSARSGAPLLEGLYALGLAAVAAFLVQLTLRADARVARSDPHPRLDVTVTAAKWRWRFDYPALGRTELGGSTTPAVLTVPAGVVVRFRMRSLDVIHSFWIPSLRFKRDAFPGRWTTFELRFAAGALATNGLCSEFCGIGHGDMRFAVEALAPADFAAWERRQ